MHTREAAVYLLSIVLTLSTAQHSIGQQTATSEAKPYVKRPPGTSYQVVVSSDGAALRGIISASVLIELEDSVKRHILLERPELLSDNAAINTIEDFEVSLADFVDCFAGTSSGSWETLYLASKGGNGASASILKEKRFVEKYGVIASGSARGLLIFYNEFSNALFPQDQISANFFNRGNSLAEPGLFTPIIADSSFESVLNGFYGQTTLSELSTSCMITGFDLIKRTQVLFVHDEFTSPARNGFTEKIRRDTPRSRNATLFADIRGFYGLDYSLIDIATASSAAPFLLPAHEVLPVSGSADPLIISDGFLYKIDPLFPTFSHIANSTEASSYSNFALLSLFSGFELPDLTDNRNGGANQWDMSLERLGYALSVSTDILLRQLELFLFSDPGVKAGQYLRIQLYGEPGTELGRILSGGFLSTDLKAFSDVGRELAETYRSSIESFVRDFIFG